MRKVYSFCSIKLYIDLRIEEFNYKKYVIQTIYINTNHAFHS